MQRILGILGVIALVVVGATWYVHWSRTRAMNSGEVKVREQPAQAAKATPETPFANQAATQAENENQAETPGIYTVPGSDTLSRTPPNRALLAGSGRYELYRQGDITWRMDTTTGQACILFATEAMWRRMIVYEHGCGAS